jgi:hypothetical protein
LAGRVCLAVAGCGQMLVGSLQKSLHRFFSWIEQRPACEFDPLFRTGYSLPLSPGEMLQAEASKQRVCRKKGTRRFFKIQATLARDLGPIRRAPLHGSFLPAGANLAQACGAVNPPATGEPDSVKGSHLRFWGRVAFSL